MTVCSNVLKLRNTLKSHVSTDGAKCEKLSEDRELLFPDPAEWLVNRFTGLTPGMNLKINFYRVFYWA
jgi:hypothetical protein